MDYTGDYIVSKFSTDESLIESGKPVIILPDGSIRESRKDERIDGITANISFGGVYSDSMEIPVLESGRVMVYIEDFINRQLPSNVKIIGSPDGNGLVEIEITTLK